MTATSWLRVDLTYTARNQLDTIARSADSGVPGPLTSWTTTYGYDATGRITGIANTVNGALGDSFFYSYDAAGRLTSEQSGGATQVFSYDSADQLTSEARSGTSPRSYSYDANGNRTNSGYVTGAGNRLLSDGVWSYEYDAEGNRIKKTKGASQETWTYGYDLDNRLVWVEKRATDGGALQLRVDYTYDAFGNRVQTWASPGGLERYAYDDRDLWADLDSSGRVQYRYLRGDVVDQLFARQAATGGGLWYETDRLGSVRKIISTGGTVLGVRDYDGYSNVLSAAYPIWTGRYGWAGREQDATGLYYNRARYYDPSTGRFTSEDPLGLAPDSNPFRYVGNQPTGYTDPFGLERQLAIELTPEGIKVYEVEDGNLEFWERVKTAVPFLGWIYGASRKLERLQDSGTRKYIGILDPCTMLVERNGHRVPLIRVSNRIKDDEDVAWNPWFAERDPNKDGSSWGGSWSRTEEDPARLNRIHEAYGPIAFLARIGVEFYLNGPLSASPSRTRFLFQAGKWKNAETGAAATAEEATQLERCYGKVCFVAGTPVLVPGGAERTAPEQDQPTGLAFWFRATLAALVALVGWPTLAGTHMRRKRMAARRQQPRNPRRSPGDTTSETSAPSEAVMATATATSPADSKELGVPTAPTGPNSSRFSNPTDATPSTRLRAEWSLVTACLGLSLLWPLLIASRQESQPRVRPNVPTASRPIETIRVGDRVWTDHSSAASFCPTGVDAATWRRLTLRAEDRWADGTVDVIEVETLQPPEWVAVHQAQVGTWVPLPLDLVEMGLPEGMRAQVRANDPCPPVSDGPGRVVLTTVSHLNGDVVELTLSDAPGVEETVWPTGAHKFCREVDGAWVSAAELTTGEQVRARDGTLTVRSVRPIAGARRVYNLTVEGEHVYYVSTLGALVHNNNCTAPKGGEYGRVRSGTKGGEVHHMPAAKVTPYPYRKAPATWMEAADHRKTASWGSSKAAEAYRQRQAGLIQKGKLREAIQMDIDDIRAKFGTKYDAHIDEMLRAFGFKK